MLTAAIGGGNSGDFADIDEVIISANGASVSKTYARPVKTIYINSNYSSNSSGYIGAWSDEFPPRYDLADKSQVHNVNSYAVSSSSHVQFSSDYKTVTFKNFGSVAAKYQVFY